MLSYSGYGECTTDSNQYTLWSGIVTANFVCQFDKPDVRKLQLRNWLCKTDGGYVYGDIFLIPSWCRRSQPTVSNALPRPVSPCCVRKVNEQVKAIKTSKQCFFLVISSVPPSRFLLELLSKLPSQGRTITCKLKSVPCSTSCLGQCFITTAEGKLG